MTECKIQKKATQKCSPGHNILAVLKGHLIANNLTKKPCPVYHVIRTDLKKLIYLLVLTSILRTLHLTYSNEIIVELPSNFETFSY